MRVMLGKNGKPGLLVQVTNQRAVTDFDFTVINGGWTGAYKGRDIHVFGDEPLVYAAGYDILTMNQDRLRGDYQDVFDNFGNPQYVAPGARVTLAHQGDDDLPF